MVGSQIPVAPSAEQGAQWLREELLDPAYHAGPGLIARIFSWLAEQWARLFSGTASGIGLIVTLAVMAAIIITVGIWLGPVRRRSRTASRATTIDLADRQVSSAELRRQAEAAAAAGDFAAAVVAGFRAAVRSGVDRAIVAPVPGLTAREAAAGLAAAFPAIAAQWSEAAACFDSVVYGAGTATQQQSAQLLHLARIAEEGPLTTAPDALAVASQQVRLPGTGTWQA